MISPSRITRMRIDHSRHLDSQSGTRDRHAAAQSQRTGVRRECESNSKARPCESRLNRRQSANAHVAFRNHFPNPHEPSMSIVVLASPIGGPGRVGYFLKLYLFAPAFAAWSSVREPSRGARSAEGSPPRQRGAATRGVDAISGMRRTFIYNS